ncbi:hypothetical protein [Metaclostridioides mangenotii]|uniref:hypothetical protein n=1 Tax=Metaclostridioides mangenotii TaxID=1540 RepID=UPI00048480DB|nr:hypothetical protein [Clostridioides mangenotii]
MTEYDKIEELLNGYRYIETEIRGKELQIKNLDISGISIDGMPKGSRVTSSIETNVLTKERLLQDIKLLEIKKESVENMLDLLTEEETDFVRLKYFKSLSYRIIQSRLGLSEKYLPKKRVFILDKLIPFATENNLI